MKKLLLLSGAVLLLAGCGSTVRVEYGDGQRTAAVEWRMPARSGLVK